MIKKLPLLLTAALVLLYALDLSAYALDASGVGWVDPRFDEASGVKLKSILVSVDWKRIDISEALSDLQIKSRKADPGHVGLQFKLAIPRDVSKLKSHGYPVQREVSILVTNVPLKDVLGYVCEQTNLVIRAHHGIVTLTLWDTQDQDAAIHAPPATL